MSHSKVLIVEDDPDLREALVDTLELSDFEVMATENGHEALEWRSVWSSPMCRWTTWMDIRY